MFSRLCSPAAVASLNNLTSPLCPQHSLHATQKLLPKIQRQAGLRRAVRIRYIQNSRRTRIEESVMGGMRTLCDSLQRRASPLSHTRANPEVPTRIRRTASGLLGKWPLKAFQWQALVPTAPKKHTWCVFDLFKQVVVHVCHISQQIS